MTFLKTFAGRVGQDRTRRRAARKAEPDVESNLSRVPALGKGFRSVRGRLQEDRNHPGNRPDLDHPQVAQHLGVVCGMRPGGGNGGVERGGGSLGNRPTSYYDPTNAPRRSGGQPGLALVPSCGRIATGLSGVDSEVALVGIGRKWERLKFHERIRSVL
jgi:hypothetical protein